MFWSNWCHISLISHHVKQLSNDWIQWIVEIQWIFPKIWAYTINITSFGGEVWRVTKTVLHWSMDLAVKAYFALIQTLFMLSLSVCIRQRKICTATGKDIFEQIEQKLKLFRSYEGQSSTKWKQIIVPYEEYICMTQPATFKHPIQAKTHWKIQPFSWSQKCKNGNLAQILNGAN